MPRELFYTLNGDAIAPAARRIEEILATVLRISEYRGGPSSVDQQRRALFAGEQSSVVILSRCAAAGRAIGPSSAGA